MATRPVLRILSRLIAAVLILVLLLTGGLYWLGTEHALRWLARRAVEASDGRLLIDGARGSLYDRVSLSRAAFKDGALEIEARALVVAWRPLALLKLEARVTEMAIGDLRIATAPAPSSEPPRLPAALGLPLNATIADAHIQRIQVAPSHVVQDLRFRYRARADAHSLELVNAAAMGWRASGALRMGAAAPFALTGKIGAVGAALGEPLEVRATVGGTLEALDLQGATSARGASGAISARLHPFGARLLESLSLNAMDVDIAAWVETLPRTKFALTLEAAMPAPGQFAGTVRAVNDIPGPLDARRLPLSRAAFAFSGSGTRWNLSDIEAGIGKTGSVRGSGSVESLQARLALELAGVEAAQLHSRLQPLPVSGRANLTGNPEAQRVIATLLAAGARLELAASHANQVVTVERGELRAEGARLEFTGRVALAGNREFSANAEFSGFDPARFIREIPAQLNGRLSARGALPPDWRAEVRAAVTESRLRGQPLTADAEFTADAKRLFEGNAQVVYAGNRLDVSGRFGEPDDKLTWSVAADNLSVLDESLAGKVDARGTLAGSIERPAVEFDLSARALASGNLAVSAIDAQGTLDAGPDGVLRLAARLARIKTHNATFDELRLDAKGTRLRHEITAALRVTDMDASLEATGGLDEKWRWSGRLETLEARGRFPFRLTAPARLTVGPGLLAIEDLRAAVADGELGPAAVRIENGVIASRGTLRDIAVKPLLAFAPQANIDPRDFTLGARWEVMLGEAASGSVEFYRASGDLGVMTERNLPLALHTLRLTVSAQGNSLEAVLEARSTRMGTLAGRLATRITRRDGAWSLAKDAPLAGSMTLDMQSLAWLRAFAPQLDQVGGRIRAQFSIAGTAGHPLLTGSASADGLAVRAIGPGVDLRDGVLRASFDGRSLTVERFDLKAGDGKIETDGTADLSDGLRSFDFTARAERARILANPQLTVVLSGAGRAGLRDLQFALGGKFKIDSGRYDLGVERRPELGEDVVVAGRAPAAAPGAKSVRADLDLTVDLSDNFAVRGYGLNAVLGGSLHITTRGGMLHALGTIHTVRGDYFAFGQVLDLQRGRLAFSGPLTNPGLDLRAARRVKSVEVGVEAGGSLQRPVVKLVSDPPMSDSDRLGWLVLGRDPQTASAAELAILQAAALTAGTRGTAGPQQRIAEGLGLDEFSVAQGGEGELGVVALGKRITDRLTVRLEQSLGGTAGGLVKIDYLLSERWRLEGTTGAESGADVLFTLRFD